MVGSRRNIVGGILFALFICLPFASGQGQDSEDPDFVSFEFSTLKIGSGDFEGIRFFPEYKEEDAESRLLEFRRLQRTGLYEYEGPNPIVFFIEVPAPTPDDPEAMERIQVGSFRVNPKWDRVLFFFEHRENNMNGGSYEIVGLDDSERGFPWESCVIFNSLDLTLYGQVGKLRSVFEPGLSDVYSYSSFLGEGFRVAFAIRTEDGPKLVFENDLEFSENKRSILVVSEPRRKGSIRLVVYIVSEDRENFRRLETPEDETAQGGT